MQLLRNRYFEVLVDHKAIKYMIKSKTESPMMRLKTLLLKLSEYTINLKYQKGSEMHTSDALSRLPNFMDTPDQKDVIPLNFLQHFTPHYIEHLNSGYLTHCILDPKILAQYLEAIEDDLEETAPAFEPVFTNVYQYYGNSLISFTNIIDDLLLQLPILIKLKVQVPMSLFSIETAPVLLDAETYLGEKREYTQIIQETELIAQTENNYIPLTQAQISLCAKIGYMYYCEYAHLLKKCTEHTCMSAIYYYQGSDMLYFDSREQNLA